MDQRRLAIIVIIRPAPRLQEKPLCRGVQITVISCLKWRPLEAWRRKKQRGLTGKPTYTHTWELWETRSQQLKHLSQKLDLRYQQAVWDTEAGGGKKNCPVTGSDTRKHPLTHREKGNNATFSVLTCTHQPISLYLQSGICSARTGPCRSVMWTFQVYTRNKKNVGNQSEEHSGYGWNFIERQKGTFTRVNRYLVTSVQMLLSLWMSSSTCGLEEEE